MEKLISLTQTHKDKISNLQETSIAYPSVSNSESAVHLDSEGQIYPPLESIEYEMFEATRLQIPRDYLFGIKETHEYRAKRKKEIEKAFSSYGDDPQELLRISPVLVCAIYKPETNLMFLAIINGHHRVRSASKFGIRHIPCEVTTPAQLLNIVNNSDKDDNHLSEQKLVDNLMNYMMDASNSFSQAIPNYVKPSTVLDAVDINDLKNRFAPFDSTKNIQNNRLIGGDIYDRE